MLFAGYLVVIYKFVHAIAQAFSRQTLTTEVRVRFQKGKLEQYSNITIFSNTNNVD
jgi:hypothetical protein